MRKQVIISSEFKFGADIVRACIYQESEDCFRITRERFTREAWEIGLFTGARSKDRAIEKFREECDDLIRIFTGR